jgi:1-acyl-sn-glycerol-3-phosphate acyltransferase
MFQFLLWEFSRALVAVIGPLVFGLRVVRARLVPRRGGALILGNHQSFLDPVLFAAGIPGRQVSSMGRATLFDNPFLARIIRLYNGFPVHRATADLGAIKETIRRLERGELVLIFPEGMRTETGEIGPLLPGALLPARKANVPIVPAVIDGAFEAWPRGRKWPGTGQIRVLYGKPIPAAEVAEMGAEEFSRRVGGAQRELQGELRKGRR